MRQTLKAMLVFVVLTAAATPVVAHHGSASFDTGKKIMLEGTVAEWIWSNPHCFLKFDVKEANGEVRQWTVETSNPPDMVNRGWARNSFKIGDKVSVTVEPVKNGSPVGRLLHVVLPSGKTLVAVGNGTEGAPRP